jgi:2-amino-4-hydroxy-6-hydroxymethyldihydropteridine diphosphokinase
MPERPGEVRSAGVTAYIGLGSNLSDPEAQVGRALAELTAIPRSELIACSALYRTAPVGPADQPDYVNAVVSLRTGLSPRELLEALQAIERGHGRQRNGTRWGPRTLDLDILLYGDRRVAEPGLRVPHPEMARRAFVLVPLADVAPAGLWVPDVGALEELLEHCSREGVMRLERA